MIYGFSDQELEHLSARIALTMGRRNLAVLDALRHHPVFMSASLDDQHALETSVMKAMDSVAPPDVKQLIS